MEPGAAVALLTLVALLAPLTSILSFSCQAFRHVFPRIVPFSLRRSKWACLGAQTRTSSAHKPMSNFPIISYEDSFTEKVLRSVAVIDEAGRAYPEPTIGERTILGSSGPTLSDSSQRRALDCSLWADCCVLIRRRSISGFANALNPVHNIQKTP